MVVFTYPHFACGFLVQVKFPDVNGVNIDAFWPFWPVDRSGDALWLGVDLDKKEGAKRSLAELGGLLCLKQR